MKTGAFSRAIDKKIKKNSTFLSRIFDYLEKCVKMRMQAIA